jgi:hypothetical protein
MTTRKRITAPVMPEPESRLEELKGFVALLADQFIDYDHLDVYDSVFRNRVDEIVETIAFKEDEAYIEEFGEYIRATNSTKARDFLKFFSMLIEAYDAAE